MAYNYEYPYTDANRYNSDAMLNEVKRIRERQDELDAKFEELQILSKEEILNLINDATTNVMNESKDYTDSVHNIITAERNNYVSNQIEILRTYIDFQDASNLQRANEHADTLNSATRAYVDEKVLTVTEMRSPITGEQQDIRVVITDIVDKYLKDNSLTAAQYDSKRLTASAYDAYELTAYDYDYKAKTLLA